jgi:1,4-dihydroxy-2-naphthoate polyprenyltransferase
MATPAQWRSAARPRTLPAAFAPVAVGTGAAIASSGFDPGITLPRAALALLVSFALQIGVNLANDYSDGIRGTDDDRVGPERLTGSGAARPATVKRAAFACFGLAGLAGLALVALSGTWWLLLVGVAAVLAAWFYTGGKHPYGYMGLGEVFVFLFFGLVAVLGTEYTQTLSISLTGVLGAVGIGLFAVAMLNANNIRDIPTDREAGKRTLAVRLGDRGARRLFAACLVVPVLLVIPIGIAHPAALIALLTALLVIAPLRDVLQRRVAGRDLIPALGATGRAELVYSLLLLVGLSVSAALS